MYNKLVELYPSSKASLVEERAKLEEERTKFETVEKLLNDVLI
jgi:hypothetical protein